MLLRRQCPFPPGHDTMKEPNPEMIMAAHKVVRAFFTEDEWDAIYYAMADYQDHGEEEAEMSHQIQAKMYELFKDC